MKKSKGIYEMISEDMMAESAKKLRDTYQIKPGAPIFQKEFGFYSMERWKKEGKMPDIRDEKEFNEYLRKLFGYDRPGKYSLKGLGWCEAAFYPEFPKKKIEDRGNHEIIQDKAGRHLLCFKGRRQGFMPTYLKHPVRNTESWEKNCKWRLNPETRERYENFEDKMTVARKEAAKGKIITQRVIGGYMYLRSLIGPEDLLYKFYDNPDLIHDCMKTWFNLADSVISRHQEYLTIDELFFGEDICYNSGPLISPEMIREFLFPYYQQLITNIKKRQLDKNRHLYYHLDTDGYANPVIPLYRELGMDVMSPFEVAAGCDVVETGQKYPDLVISGGIDKRVLARGKEAIDKHLDYIIPVMKKRGGYIPTCDHGVPEEVDFKDYVYFRKRLQEY